MVWGSGRGAYERSLLRGRGLGASGPAWLSIRCVSCPRLLLCLSSASSCCAVSWRGPAGLRSWLWGEGTVRACRLGCGGQGPQLSTCRSAMEAFSLCSRAQARELVLTPRSCSRMAGRRVPARSRSSRSRTTQWSHTAGRRAGQCRVWGGHGKEGLGVHVVGMGQPGVMELAWGH